MPWDVKNDIVCYAKNCENHASFVDGCLPECYARKRFMKNSMSVGTAQQVIITLYYLFIFSCEVAALHSIIWLTYWLTDSLTHSPLTLSTNYLDLGLWMCHYILFISSVYLRCISGRSYVYLRYLKYISGISLLYHLFIWGI